MYRRFFVFSMLCLVSSGNQSSSAETSIPSPLVAQFESNVAELSPLEITWSRTCRTPLNEAKFLAAIKYPHWAKHDLFAKTQYTYRWQDGKQYFLIEGKIIGEIPRSPKDKTRVVPYGFEWAFNMGRVYVGDAEKQAVIAGHRPTLSIDFAPKPTFRKPDEVLFKPNFLNNSGYWLPQEVKNLGGPAEHIVAHYVNTGHRITKFESGTANGFERNLIQIQDDELTILFTFEPRFANALVKRVDTYRKSGRIAREWECFDFKQVPNKQLWIPVR